MNFKNICKPFLIYIIFSILITIYYYNSKGYKKMKTFSIKMLKKIPDNEHEKILNDSLPTFLRNPNSKQIIKNQVKNPNYILMYLSSNALMFIILFILCEFNYIKTAWIILCISISLQLIITYFMNYILDRYGESMLKNVKKNN